MGDAVATSARITDDLALRLEERCREEGTGDAAMPCPERLVDELLAAVSVLDAKTVVVPSGHCGAVFIMDARAAALAVPDPEPDGAWRVALTDPHGEQLRAWSVRTPAQLVAALEEAAQLLDHTRGG